MTSIGTLQIYPEEYISGIWVETIYAPNATAYFVPGGVNEWGYKLSVVLRSNGDDKPGIGGTLYGTSYTGSADEIWINIFPAGDGNILISNGSYQWGWVSGNINTLWTLSKESGQSISSKLMPHVGGTRRNNDIFHLGLRSYR